MKLETRENPIFARRPEDEQREITARTTLRRPSARRTLVDAIHRKNAVRDIDRLPEAGESLHVICRGNFPLFQIIPATLALATPARIDRASIATLGFSRSNVTELLTLLDAGQIGSVDIIASVYFERQNPSEYRQMAEGLAARGQRLVGLRAHAKVIALALSDGRRFAVESSANLRSCRNIEQISIFNGADLYEFHSGWIARAIDAAGAAKP